MDYVSLEEAGEEICCKGSGMEEAEEDMVIRDLVRGLKSEEQEIVILRFKQGLRIREIGRIMGMPMRTVQSKLRAVLRKLRKELERG